MSFFKRLHQRLIRWATFDPKNPVCGIDPRTGESFMGNEPSIDFSRIDYRFEPNTREFLKIAFHYYCQRLYYIINPHKEKRVEPI